MAVPGSTASIGKAERGTKAGERAGCDTVAEFDLRGRSRLILNISLKGMSDLAPKTIRFLRLDSTGQRSCLSVREVNVRHSGIVESRALLRFSS